MNKILGLLVVFAAILAVASAWGCSHPKFPKYGYHSGRQHYYPKGHKIYYWCQHGYKLYGYKQNQCDYDGYYYWRYPTPECRSKLTHTHMLIVNGCILIYITYQFHSKPS